MRISDKPPPAEGNDHNVIMSMTGYGRAQQVIEGHDVTVELRSVNHRYFECSVRTPRAYGYLEEKLKSCLQSRMSRGKIEAGIYTDNRNITLDGYFDEWLNGKRGSIKGNTLKWYATYYKGHISPCLGNVKLQKIERRQVLSFQKDLSEANCLSGRATIL